MTAIHRRVVALDKAQEANRARVRRYRSKNQRIDFVPSPDVLQIIEHHFRAALDKSSPCLFSALGAVKGVQQFHGYFLVFRCQLAELAAVGLDGFAA